MKGLTNNQLKLIALMTMTVDHIGAYLLPHILWLRIVGRLAFPIFAYMIAEGCRHTRSMGKYFSTMALFALVCQLVDFFARHSLYMSILVTFSMSIGLIWLWKKLEQSGKAWLLAFALGCLAALYICEELPRILPGFDVDYGFIGVMIPMLIYFGKNKVQRLTLWAIGLCLLASDSAWIQWLALLALPLLALYNGQRGKWNIKWLFYIYYPLHLVAIYFVSYLL